MRKILFWKMLHGIRSGFGKVLNNLGFTPYTQKITIYIFLITQNRMLKSLSEFLVVFLKAGKEESTHDKQLLVFYPIYPVEVLHAPTHI